MDYHSDGGYIDEEKAHVWLADLVFRRENRTVKYVEDGNFLILAELTKWDDVVERMQQNLGWICVFLVGTLLNVGLLTISLPKRKHHLKFECLVASLAFCNAVLSLGFLTYTFLLDIFYDVDSFDTLVSLNRQEEGVHSLIWPLAKKVVHSVIVDNLAIVRSLVMFQMGLERYLRLFSGSYAAELRAPLIFCAYCALPYLFTLVALDPHILTAVLHVPASYVDLARLFSWTLPIALGAVFATSSTCRPTKRQRVRGSNNQNTRQTATKRKRVQSVVDQYEPSHSLALLVLFTMETFQILGFLPALLRKNFLIELVLMTGSDAVVGSVGWNRALDRVLFVFYEVAKCLFLVSPLAMALIVLTVSQHYRRRATPRIISRLLRRIFYWERIPRLDYRTETMRSIIAEHSRTRQMRPTAHRL